MLSLYHVQHILACGTIFYTQIWLQEWYIWHVIWRSRFIYCKSNVWSLAFARSTTVLTSRQNALEKTCLLSPLMILNCPCCFLLSWPLSVSRWPVWQSRPVICCFAEWTETTVIFQGRYAWSQNVSTGIPCVISFLTLSNAKQLLLRQFREAQQAFSFRSARIFWASEPLQ